MSCRFNLTTRSIRRRIRWHIYHPKRRMIKQCVPDGDNVFFIHLVMLWLVTWMLLLSWWKNIISFCISACNVFFLCVPTLEAPRSGGSQNMQFIKKIKFVLKWCQLSSSLRRRPQEARGHHWACVRGGKVSLSATSLADKHTGYVATTQAGAWPCLTSSATCGSNKLIWPKFIGSTWPMNLS